MFRTIVFRRHHSDHRKELYRPEAKQEEEGRCGVEHFGDLVVTCPLFSVEDTIPFFSLSRSFEGTHATR